MLVAAAWSGLVGTSPQPAKAENPATSAWVDADAPVVVRIDPGAIEPAARLASRVSSRLAGMAGLARILARAAVDIDPLTTDGLVRAGVDVTRPIWLSVGAIDIAAADARYERIRHDAAIPDAPPVLWRTRAAIPLAHPARAEALVERIAALVPDIESVARARIGTIAALGADAQKRADVIAALAAAKVIALGQISGSSHTVLVALRDGALVIDVLTPFAGGKIQWARDIEAIVALIGRGPRADRGWSRRFAPSAFAVHIDPGRTLAAIRLSTADTRVARGIASQSLGIASLGALGPPCEGATAITERGTLGGLTVRIRLDGGNQVVGEAAWAIRKPSLTRALTFSGGGQLPAARGQVLAAAVSIAPGRIRQLWFPPAMARARDAFWNAVAMCGEAAPALIWAVGWPEIGAAFATEVSGLGDTAEALVGGIAGASVAARELSFDTLSLWGAVELSTRRPQAKAVRALLDLVFGPNIRDAQGARIWTGGPLVPFERAARGRFAQFGAGLGQDAVFWYLGGERRRLSPRQLAAGVIDVDAALRQLGGELPALSAWLDSLRRRDATAEVEARVSRRAVHARVVLTVK